MNAGLAAKVVDTKAGRSGLGLDAGDFVGDLHGAHYCAYAPALASAFLRHDDAVRICKNAQMNNDRAAYEAFIGYLMELAGVDSSTALARRAKLAPSTVNKAIGEKPIKHKLSSKTIEGLAAAVGLSSSDAHALLAKALRGEAMPEVKPPKSAKLVSTALHWLPSLATRADVEVPPISTLPMNLPVTGVAMGGAGDGLFLNGEPTEYVRRPPGLALAPKAFGVYIQGDSMSPRYDAGDLVIVNPSRPAKIGDHVLIELFPTVFEGEQTDIGPAFVKRLVRKGSVEIVCEQYNPPTEIRYPAEHVKSIYRVMTNAELFGAG